MKRPFPLIGTRRIRNVALLLCLFFLTACARGNVSDADDPSSEWRGTTTTEGDVTTVVNESGSVWGGNARMVEEASIGVEIGEEPYLFSWVRGLWANDEEIFVLDYQIAELRVFDLAGDYLRTIGRAGQGPGEFQRPLYLMVAPDGRIIVLDVGAYALLVLSPEGDEIARWRVEPRSLMGIVSPPGPPSSGPPAGTPFRERNRHPSQEPISCSARSETPHSSG